MVSKDTETSTEYYMCMVLTRRPAGHIVQHTTLPTAPSAWTLKLLFQQSSYQSKHGLTLMGMTIPKLRRLGYNHPACVKENCVECLRSACDVSMYTH